VGRIGARRAEEENREIMANGAQGGLPSVIIWCAGLSLPIMAGGLVAAAVWAASIITSEVASLRDDFRDLRGGFDELNGEVKELRGDLNELSGEVTELRGGFDELSGEVKELRGGFDELSGEVTELRGDLNELSGEVTELRGDLNELSGEVTELRGGFDELSGDFKTLASGFDRQEQSLLEIVGEIEDMDQGLAEQIQISRSNRLDIQYLRAVSEAQIPVAVDSRLDAIARGSEMEMFNSSRSASQLSRVYIGFPGGLMVRETDPVRVQRLHDLGYRLVPGEANLYEWAGPMPPEPENAPE
jgi:predicted nuclease with TOPRIM domain